MDDRHERFLAQDDPWPTTDVLAKLVGAAEHLLDDHDCDVDGWEEIAHAARAGRVRLAALGVKVPPARSKEPRGVHACPPETSARVRLSVKGGGESPSVVPLPRGDLDLVLPRLVEAYASASGFHPDASYLVLVERVGDDGLLSESPPRQEGDDPVLPKVFVVVLRPAWHAYPFKARPRGRT